MARREFVFSDRCSVTSTGTPAIEEVHYSTRLDDGSLKPAAPERVVSAGNVAALLALDEQKDEVVLVRRFRPALLRREAPAEGWVLELPSQSLRSSDAGAAESAAEAACRAAKDVGYAITSEDVQHVQTMLTNPGLTDQRIHLYAAEIDIAPKISDGTGNGEQTAIVERIAYSTLASMLDRGELQDATLVVAAQWLRRPRAFNEAGKPLDYEKIVWRANDGREIGLITGPLDEVQDIDVWLNPENTDMQMARVFEPTLSGRIRYLGARKSRDGTILSDTIADALRQAVADQIFVKPGSVIPTIPGTLKKSHKVKELFHVASTQYSPSGYAYTGMEFASEGLRNALRLAESHQRTLPRRMWRRLWGGCPLESMLVPLLGAGGGGVPAAESAKALVPTVMKHLVTPGIRLRRIYFLAYKPHEKRAIERAIKRATLKRPSSEGWKKIEEETPQEAARPAAPPAEQTAPAVSAREPANVA